MKVYSVLLIIVFSLTTNIFSQVPFTAHPITTDANGASSVYAVDVDGDGDIDVLYTSISDNKIVWYENLRPVDIDDDNLLGAPVLYHLFDNYPNLFNPITTINYNFPVKSQVELVVYNAPGESVMQLVNEEKHAGSYGVKLDATELSSGIYFYRMQA